jgi:gamma-glutamyltranspeptidase/glutathione hydrolase
MVISSNYPFAVHAGCQALRMGGSAADAAIVTALTQISLSAGAFVSYAGVATAVHYDSKGSEASCIHGGYQVPQLELDGLTIPGVGGRTVLTPGTIAAFELLHRQHGVLDWADLFEPAIWVAQKGFQIGKFSAWLFRSESAELAELTDRGDFFRSSMVPLGSGDTFRQPSLALTLKGTANEGASHCYRGDWADSLVMAVQAAGGHLSENDLSCYRALESQPAIGRFYDSRVFSLAGPSQGGQRLAVALAILEAGRSQLTAPQSVETLFWLVCVGRLSNAIVSDLPVVKRYFPDLDFESCHEPEVASYIWRRLQVVDRTRLLKDLASNRPASEHSASILAADRHGNVVSLLHSSNSIVSFGSSRLRVGGVPIPGSASHQQKAVASAGPGGRIADPTNPCLVLRDGQVQFAAGVTGSNLDRVMLRRLLDLLHFKCGDQSLALSGCPGGPDYTGELWRERLDSDRYSQEFASKLQALGLETRLAREMGPVNWVGMARNGDGWRGLASNPDKAYWQAV